MLQMHAYYVSNISNEIKHAYKELSDEKFEDAVTKTTFPFDDEIFDENDDELENDQFENGDELENNQFENNEGENQISNSQNFDSFFNVTDIELRQILEVEVTVEIPLSTEYTDSGEQDFNIESIINKSLERRESGINNITE
jgi:anionic cell wall polymer biosynthesis LytR-Cps2A-Psr (LCP) family protein